MYGWQANYLHLSAICRIKYKKPTALTAVGFFEVRRGKSDRVHDFLGTKGTGLDYLARHSRELAEIFVEHSG